jgi:rhodanese-related sulfurtransferase
MLHIRPAQVAAALEGGDNLILLDVRAPEEWEAGHIEGAQLATVELTFEILDSWPKDTLVLYSTGNRSLDRASYFRARLTNPRSMDGDSRRGWRWQVREEIRRHRRRHSRRGLPLRTRPAPAITSR